MSAAPYWGDLPGPKVSTRPDYSSKAPRRQSQDTTAALAPQSKSNRISTQTNVTEAQTESTLSPYGSPRHSFQGHGLAPRPPSQGNYPPDIVEKRRRRASRNRDEEGAYTASGALPAAPDAPKAVAVSFRHPYGNGGLPYTIPQPGASKQPDIPPSPGIMDPESYNIPSADRPKRSSTTSNRRASSGSTATARKGGTRENGHRKSSLGNEVDRHFITKEEKRARAEVAERNARERASRGAAQPTVRFKDKETESEPDSPQTEISADPLPAQSGRAPRRGSQSRKSPRPQAAIATAIQYTSFPQRDLSFRERAARQDIKIPNGGPDSPATPPTTTPTNGSSVARSGSNKLKKDPPGDPWYQRRVEAEKKYGQITGGELRGASQIPVAAPGPGTSAAPAPVGPSNKTAGGSVRNKVPPLNTAVTRRQPGRQPVAANDDLDSPITTGNSAGVVKREEPVSARTPSHSLFPSTPDPPHSAPSKGKIATGAVAGATATAAGTGIAIAGRQQYDGSDSNDGDHPDHEHHFSQYFHRHEYRPGQGLYNPPKFLSEWRKGTVGILSGTMLDLSDETTPTLDKGQTWWETPPSQRRGSISSRPRRAEAFDGEYDETNAPTRFKPPLCLKCGPLLRYCGMRTERIPSRSGRNGPALEREFWRGTVMIVTADDESEYDIAPTLRLFAQPMELLPPPPTEVRGELPPEYVDPIAGHPKLGRKGETRYVRPAYHLDEGKDHSKDDSDEGLFEKTRSPPDFDIPEGSTDAPGSFADRKKKSPVDGEKLGKYKDVRGYRLHAERGYTFWRFSVEVELRDKEQRIAYRINRGPATGFWVPAKNQSMNIMFHSCNGFSLSVNPDELSGPDPLWRDVLNNHQSRPFHVMLGGGDQLYCDAVMRQTSHFQEWLNIRNPLHKRNAPFTAEMQDDLERFYLERYCMWFSQGLFGLANSQIPMVNIYDDHDIIDGFGSYPDHFMSTPVFSGLGNVAFKYYMLFQHQSIVDETEETESSWTLGLRPGPYIHELSRSLFMFLGSKIALLAVDCRTERKRDQVIRNDTWEKLINRCYNEIVKGKTEHLLVLLGVPIAYPRLVWLENILTSRLLDPIKALGKTGLFGNVFNKFDGGVEVLDDLDDHWTAKNHKDERRVIMEDLQDLAADRSVRVTILSGDVHLGAIGQFYSNPKLELPKHKDFRYMPNVISSAIVNTPPPDLMADVLNKRNKVHHLDKDTDENMIPMFAHGVEGKARNNKHLLPHRNWCSIREYTPGQTPPSSPPGSLYEGQSPAESPGAQGGGFISKGITRRLSKRNRGPSYRADVIDSRPPISARGPGGLFRTLSSRGRRSDSDVPEEGKRPSTGKRTLSLTRGDFSLFRRGSKNKRSNADDGGINGTWGDSDPEDDGYDREDRDRGGGGFLGAIGLRGGGGSFEEFSEGDDSYFTARAPANMGTTRQGAASKTARLLGEEAPPATKSRGFQQPRNYGYGTTTTVSGPGQQSADDSFRPKPFHRTPTSDAIKPRRARTQEVNVQGGLDICLNVEVSAKDPAGITVPYRLLVPRLWYDAADGEEVELPERTGAGVKRLLSLSRGKSDANKGKGVASAVEWQHGGQGQGQRTPTASGGNGVPAPGTAI